MTTIELLKLNRVMLKVCLDNGIRVDDVLYIDLYDDYIRLIAEGNKVSYVVAYLAEHYTISERKVYSLLKHLHTDCNLCAV